MRACLSRFPRWRDNSALSLASLPETMLMEIFLRLPTHPASLRLLYLSCRQFPEIIASPAFLNLFRSQHGNVPSLVSFFIRARSPRFLPVIGSSSFYDDSDSESDDVPIAGAGVLLERMDGTNWTVLSCRHGWVLLQSRC
jgi:hypothetical protein